MAGKKGAEKKRAEKKSPGTGAPRLEASFLTSAPGLKGCPSPDGPEVAFAGRSNAGKSSVLNRITGTRGLAKVSRTPGRTQLLNFFALASGGRLVDLPGYGYARAARARQDAWQRAVNEYLSRRDCLVALVLVTDIRHPGQTLDTELIEWAVASALPAHVLLNKADKLGYGAQQRALSRFRADWRHAGGVSAQTFSALDGRGTDELVRRILEWTSQ